MCKVYQFDDMAEMHKIMKEIECTSTMLGKKYCQSASITPEILKLSEAIDDLVNKYMALSEKEYEAC